MNDVLYPGFSEDDLASQDQRILIKLAGSIAGFIKKREGTYADISSSNKKMEEIKRLLKIDVEQIMVNDFNFDPLPAKQYDTIFCLEVLEHLQNPLFFLMQIKKVMKEDSLLYISFPSKPRWLWTSHHFFEYDRKHFEKWLLTPAGFKIVRHKKFRLARNWTAYLIGVRPLLAVFKNGFKPLFRIYYNIDNVYEIKLEDR